MARRGHRLRATSRLEGPPRRGPAHRPIASPTVPTPAQRRYEPPGSLASKLGNEFVGDGFAFRGRGLLMLTGRFNYWEASESLGEPTLLTDPTVVTTPEWAATTAGWFWWRHDLNAVADREDFERACETCRAVNGGQNGLSERQQFYERAYEVL